MRIISDFKDFYDPVQRQGQDKNCTWLRKAEVFEYKVLPSFDRKNKFHWINISLPVSKFRTVSFTVLPHVLGFCGELYPFLEIYHWNDDNSRVVCYDVVSSDETISEFVENYCQRSHKYSPRSYGLEKQDIQIFFDEMSVNKNLKGIFVENQAPIFIVNLCYNKIVFHGRNNTKELPVVNGVALKATDLSSEGYYRQSYLSLKDFAFFKVRDSYRAFQDIHQYLSGVLGVGHPYVPEMSDAVKIAAHGYDKFSFRKQPSK